MIEVKLPDGSVARFPDGTDPAVIKQSLQKRFGSQPAETAPQQPAVPPHIAARESGMTPEQFRQSMRDRPSPQMSAASQEMHRDTPVEIMSDPRTGGLTSRRRMSERMRPTRAQSAVIGGTSGTTLGAMDEILGATGIAEGLVRDGSPQEWQRFRREEARALRDAADRDFPVTTTGAEIGGAMLLPGGQVSGAKTATGQALRGMATGAGMGAVYGFNTGEENLEERGENAARTAALGGALGAAAPAVTNQLGKLLTSRTNGRAQREFVKNAPSPQELRDKAGAIYDNADKTAKIPREKLQEMAIKLSERTKQAGRDKMVTPKADRAMQRILEDAAQEGPVGFRDVQTLRNVSKAARSSNEPQERMLGSMVTEGLDELVQDIPGIESAREMWGMLRKVEGLEDIIKSADGYVSGAESGIRNQISSILKSKSKRGAYTADEIKAMKAIVNRDGVLNRVLAQVGKMGLSTSDGRGGGLGFAMSAGLGGAYGGVPGAIALPAAASLADKLATRNSQKGVELLKALTATGGKLPAQKKLTASQQAMIESLQKRGGVVAGNQ